MILFNIHRLATIITRGSHAAVESQKWVQTSKSFPLHFARITEVLRKFSTLKRRKCLLSAIGVNRNAESDALLSFFVILGKSIYILVWPGFGCRGVKTERKDFFFYEKRATFIQSGRSGRQSTK